MKFNIKTSMAVNTSRFKKERWLRDDIKNENKFNKSPLNYLKKRTFSIPILFALKGHFQKVDPNESPQLIRDDGTLAF